MNDVLAAHVWDLVFALLGAVMGVAGACAWLLPSIALRDQTIEELRQERDTAVRLRSEK